MISKLPIVVRLTVVEGAGSGKVFDFLEPDNFLLGRDAPGSRAHFRLGPEDRTVSRNHFLLEINPPDCYLQDVGSLNGTFVIRPTGDKKVFFLRGRTDREWAATAQQLAAAHQCQGYQEATGSLKLEDGDLIRVGKTSLKVQMAPEDAPQAAGLADKTPEPKDRFLCRRCGKDITSDLLGKNLEELAGADMLCQACRQKQQNTAPPVEVSRCWTCRQELGDRANADGRAAELQEVALYWCPDCAAANQHKVLIPQVGDYRLLRELGAGGFGVVFLAWQESTGRLSALKITRDKVKSDLRLIQRFKREIAIQRELHHPHLVKLYDEGMTKGDNYFFVSEYLPAGSLADLMHRHFPRGMPYREACALIIQALKGLSHFHESLGFVHRDLKPGNILLRKVDQHNYMAKVADFGLARSYILHGGTITRKDEFAGTYNFMAPEQISDFKGVKPPADVYSMGVTLYYLITTEFPYDFPTRLKVMEMIPKGKKPRHPIDILLGEDQPIPIEKKQKGLPKPLAAVINQAIQKDPGKRFPSAKAFQKALEEALS